jgi:hypothetical protein
MYGFVGVNFIDVVSNLVVITATSNFIIVASNSTKVQMEQMTTTQV